MKKKVSCGCGARFKTLIFFTDAVRDRSTGNKQKPASPVAGCEGPSLGRRELGREWRCVGG